MENEIIYIKLDDIIPNRFQPREVFEEKALNELAESIKQHGVIQPIIVRPIDNKYEIVAGERRYKATALAGLTKIPCVVKQLDDKESSIIAYIENAQRRNVSSIEEARISDRILKNNNMTQEQLAYELGISQSTLANKLRLLSLPNEIQEALMKNEISERHARSLLTVKDAKNQLELLNKIKMNKMSVRDLDSEIKNMNGNNYNGNMFIDNTNSIDNNQFVPTGMQSNNNFNASKGTFNEPINTLDINYETNNNISPDRGVATDTSFTNFLNTFDDSKYAINETSPITNELNTQTVSPSTPTDTNFMDFLNTFDESKYTINETSPIANGVNTQTVSPSTPTDTSFTNFLNTFDDSKYTINETSPIANGVNTQTVTPSTPTDTNFMDFLNTFDESKYTNQTNIETISDEPSSSPSSTNNTDFMSFLNTFDESQYTLNQPTVESLNSSDNLNSTLQDVNSNQNYKYVEQNPKYVDITKPNVLSSVDDVISELQTSINKIKNSKFKIDTDEINFDDVYQITIKIDKKENF